GEKKPEDLHDNWGAADLIRNDGGALRRCNQVFRPEATGRSELKAIARGTPFQVKVWRALLRIPAGCLASYGQIARAIGQPGAVRAVGQACGSNVIGFLIPCHRVIRETGIVEGYRWGTDRKR